MTEQGHSRLGASGAYRWMKCPGSVRLSEGLYDEPSEYAAEGTHAHAVAAWCLEENMDAWEVIGQPFENIVCTSETADAVHVYLEYVRMLSTEPGIMHVVDYKHGIGVQVEVENNPQLMYYGNLAWLKGESGVEMQLSAIGLHPAMFGTADYVQVNDGPIKKIILHIVQPRGFHVDGPCRSWEITPEDLEKWVEEELLPAMRRVDEPGADGIFCAGEWCRFCPAKLLCPELSMFYEEMRDLVPEEMNDEVLAVQLDRIKPVKALIKALEAEGFARLSKGKHLTGWKLVQKSVDRVWRDDALEHIKETLGDKMYQDPKLVSPAQAEKLPGGKALAAKWAYKPTDSASLTLAPQSDRREAQTPETGSDAFSELLSK